MKLYFKLHKVNIYTCQSIIAIRESEKKLKIKLHKIKRFLEWISAWNIRGKKKQNFAKNTYYLKKDNYIIGEVFEKWNQRKEETEGRPEAATGNPHKGILFANRMRMTGFD